MKLLNEANLVYFSTCSSPSSMEGWLYKKGEVNKAFQKRWFVLKGNLLFYFDKPSDKVSEHHIDYMSHPGRNKV